MFKSIIVLVALGVGTGISYADTLSLKDCLGRAAATNLGLKAASRDVAIAREQETVTGSTRLPRVDVQAGYTAQQEPQAAKFGALMAETQDADFATFNLGIYQTLYDFGRTKAREGAARVATDAARQSYAAGEQDLFLQVVRAYYGILEAGKFVTAAKDELASMISHQQTAKAMYEEGVVTRNDLLQAEVRVANSRQRVLAAENAVENGWLLLNYLTGAPAAYRGELVEETVQLPPPSTGSPSTGSASTGSASTGSGSTGSNGSNGSTVLSASTGSTGSTPSTGSTQKSASAPQSAPSPSAPSPSAPSQSAPPQSDLFARRTELQAQRDVVAAQDYLVQEAKTDYYPEFFAHLGLDYMQNSKVREQAIMSATIGLKVNLFDGNAKTSRLRQAVEARSREEDRLRDLELKIRLELATAQNDLKVAAARIKASEKAISQGVENLRITKDRYAEKVGTATDVVDAQTLLTQTRTDYYQSVFDYEVAAARVKRATGEL
ncbi:hypothetical protein GMSM_41620 [Geomonas sp. Red276]